MGRQVQTAPEAGEHGLGVEAAVEPEAAAVADVGVEVAAPVAVECELFAVPEHSISSRQQMKPQL